MNEYVFTLDRPGRERTYMSCAAPEFGIRTSDPQCQLFMRHARSGLRLSAKFSQDYGDDWQRIVDHLQALLDAWYVSRPSPEIDPGAAGIR